MDQSHRCLFKIFNAKSFRAIIKLEYAARLRFGTFIEARLLAMVVPFANFIVLIVIATRITLRRTHHFIALI